MNAVAAERKAPVALGAWLSTVAPYAALIVAALGARGLMLLTVDYRDPATLWLPYVGAGVSTLIAARIVWTTGFYKHWRFWERAPESPAIVLVAGVILATAILIEAFAASSYVLSRLGLITIEPPEPTLEQLVKTAVSEATYPSGSGGNSSWYYPSDEFQEFEQHYLWHVADAVPGLEIPTTLNWHVDSEVDARGRFLVVAFKILVILPVIGLVAELWANVRKRRAARQTELAETGSC